MGDCIQIVYRQNSIDMTIKSPVNGEIDHLVTIIIKYNICHAACCTETCTIYMILEIKKEEHYRHTS